MRSEYLELRKTFDDFYKLCEIKIEKVYSFCKKEEILGATATKILVTTR